VLIKGGSPQATQFIFANKSPVIVSFICVFTNTEIQLRVILLLQDAACWKTNAFKIFTTHAGKLRIGVP
jgi:hypothetical protein